MTHTAVPSPRARITSRAIAMLAIMALAAAVWCTYHWVAQTRAAATRTADSFIDNIQRHNYEAAHALILSAAQDANPAAAIQAAAELVEATHGKITSRGTPAWNLYLFNGNAFVRFTYPLKRAHGGGTAAIVVERLDNSAYAVTDLHFE